MNAARSVMILLLACSSVPTAILAAGDGSGIPEKKESLAREITAHRTLFRESRLPHLPISSRQAEFLLDRPRISLALAHRYAPFLDPYNVEVRPDRVIHIYDPGGLAGDAELIEARPGRRVYLVAGYFDILKIRFNGQMVLTTTYSEQKENGEISVDATTTADIRVRSAFVGAFARVVDFLFPGKVDKRIERFVRAAESIALAVHRDPEGAYGNLRASGEVSAEELEEFARAF